MPRVFNDERNVRSYGLSAVCLVVAQVIFFVAQFSLHGTVEAFIIIPLLFFTGTTISLVLDLLYFLRVGRAGVGYLIPGLVQVILAWSIWRGQAGIVEFHVGLGLFNLLLGCWHYFISSRR